MQREPTARTSASLGRRLAQVAVLTVAATWLVSLGLVIVFERLDTQKPANAIVVLGAAQYDGRPSPVLRARVDHAIELWRRGLAPRLIVTGGSGAETRRRKRRWSGATPSPTAFQVRRSRSSRPAGQQASRCETFP